MNMDSIKHICTGLGTVALLSLITACGSSPSQTPQNQLKTRTSRAVRPQIMPTAQSILQIQATSGSIIVQTNDSTQTIVAIADGQIIPLSQQGLVISLASDVTQANIDITVPKYINLNLAELHGNIIVQGVSGEMNLTTQDGNISVQGKLGGMSSFTTTSGTITFAGMLSTKGTDVTMTTDQGDISLTLSIFTSSFHLHATGKMGTITSTFPVVVNHNTNGASSEVNQDISTLEDSLDTTPIPAMGSQITLETDQGNIKLDSQSIVDVWPEG